MKIFLKSIQAQLEAPMLTFNQLLISSLKRLQQYNNKFKKSQMDKQFIGLVTDSSFGYRIATLNLTAVDSSSDSDSVVQIYLYFHRKMNLLEKFLASHQQLIMIVYHIPILHHSHRELFIYLLHCPTILIVYHH